MRNDIVEILCDINPLLDPDDEDMSIAEFLESKQLMELIAMKTTSTVLTQ